MAAMNINSIPSILKDFAVYVDGTRYAGQVSEIELPKITKNRRLQGRVYNSTNYNGFG